MVALGRSGARSERLPLLSHPLLILPCLPAFSFCAAAMRQTITNMLGTLPPQFFRVVISTEAENLAQLMYSVLLSGYMFANAWTRLSLTQSLTGGEPVRALIEPELASLYGTAVDGGGEPVAVPAAAAAAVGSGSLDDAAYAPGTQVRLGGTHCPVLLLLCGGL